MSHPDFDKVLDQILTQDPRYAREAYGFLREALDYTQKMISQGNPELVRHVTGRELLEGIREFALSQFGPMTLPVFEAWGIHRGEDFGEIVFNLVDHGFLNKTEQDSRKDFQDAYNFHDAFRKPFLPSRKLS